MIYFISDIHLGFFSKEIDYPRELLFLRLMDKISEDAKYIYFLGDIFDFWFDYKTVIPKQFYRVLTKFWELKNKGINIEFLIGNHDFGHHSFFRDELDIPLHQVDIIREHYGKKFYLSHGDGKNKQDKGYLFLKKILRNRFSLWLYLKLHPDFGIWLASGSSKTSRAYTDQKESIDDEPMRFFAYRKIDNGMDFVIMGHRHKLEFTKYNEGIYVNLGDWFKVPHIAKYDGTNLSLLKVEDVLR